MRLSVNIASQVDLSAYHPTPQSIEFVHGLASAALDGGGAHALLGAYGAGKSSLAAFALNELSCPTNSPATRTRLLGADQSPVAKVRNAGGLVPMPVVGAVEPLASRVILALRAFARSARQQRSPALKSCAIIDPRTATDEQALSALIDVARTMRQQGCAGALLAIDEFGRHLEHMLAATSDNDFHLLQSIAEATGQADSPLSLVIIQHYGLEHYGARFQGSRRYEWEKVRGRFTETVLNNTETDAAHIAANVLTTLDLPKTQIEPRLRAEEQGPRITRDPEFCAAARKCFPLHPMTIVILSRLARLLGQNDRTIVGWLTSKMDSGFQAVQPQCRDGWIYPDALYKHFFADALLVPSNPSFAKRFAAIHAAHERMGDDLSNDARVLFRTLSLLSFCTGRGVKSDRTSALACLPEGFPFDQCIKDLTNRSLVLYRKYRGEYLIWEGSDYDIALRIDEELSASSLDAASEMNRRSERRVLAHSHLIRTGNRRTASVLWLNEGDDLPGADGEPRILIWVADRLVNGTTPSDVVGATTIHALTPHLEEAAAIRRLLNQDPVLQEDTIAAKELRSRLEFHEDRIASLIEGLLGSDLGWQVGERRFTTLQQAISSAMDVTYTGAFDLHNELVNRHRVSAQVTSALRKLISKLYTCSEQEGLGIEKFPAERIIYESLFKRTGLHFCAEDGTWRLRLGGTSLMPRLAECIAEIRRFFMGGKQPRPPSVEFVVDRLAAPPYGVKRTPVLLLCILILLHDKDAYELYEDGQFLPHWGPDTLLRLLKVPARFAIATAATSPIDSSFMVRYRKTLATPSEFEKSNVPAVLAREALRRYARLSPYAQRTKTVSSHAQAFRRALEIAKSPGDLLFHEIPRAIGHRSLPRPAIARKDYLRALGAVWAELERADDALIGKLEAAVLETLGCSDLKEARGRCRYFAERVLDDGNLHHGYENFLSRIVEDKISDNKAWLVSIVDAGLGIATPIRSWSDSHAAHGEFLLRRNLVGMQRVGDLLSKRRIQDDAAPFAVFWPNPDTALDDDMDMAAKKFSTLVESIPDEKRMAIIAYLARRTLETT